jgi:ABC-type polysaccharide transport system, permease component
LYNITSLKSSEDRRKLGTIIKKDFAKNKNIYFLFIPVLVFYIVFQYFPIYGLTLAFKDFSPVRGILGSPWVGFDNFRRFFNSVYFGTILKNTLIISTYEIIFGFPAPIIFALLLNEVRNTFFKRTIQTVTYLPHFISTMVICGMILDFSLKGGLFNDLIAFFGGQRSDLLMQANMFRPIYIASGIWQGIGWGSIIYLSALTSIDPELYEAAYIDGANRFRQVLHITIPGIIPTITILLILKIGGLMSVGFEKIFLLYNPTTYGVADVISTFNYRKGLVDNDYSFSTAVGLFNSAINIVLLIMANTISKKVNENSLW